MMTPARLPVEPTRTADTPVNFCPKCGAMYTGNSHTCRPGRRPSR